MIEAVGWKDFGTFFECCSDLLEPNGAMLLQAITIDDRLEALGYDDRFRRLWRLYLSYCEAGFAERRIGVAQALLAKPRWCDQRQRLSSQASLPPYSAAASSTSLGAGTQAS